jgi:CubicO group peptidase (beta-lactamase class C family)
MMRDLAIEETVAAAVALAPVPGLALALVEDGEISWAGGFGVRNADASDPVDAETIFAVASLSKPPFAYLVLKRAANVDGRTRSFLAHTSGMGNWDDGDGEPGRWRYSGEGYMQLQREIEEASGMRLEALAETELFRPLGLERTSYVWSDEWENTADGHGTSSTGGHRFREPWSAFSLHTSASEYARLVMAMIADERADPMFAPATHVDDELSWGLGFGLSGEVFWHWGDCGDFQSTVAGSRRDARALVCLTNSENGLPLCAELTRRVLGENYARPVQAVIDRGW